MTDDDTVTIAVNTPPVTYNPGYFVFMNNTLTVPTGFTDLRGTDPDYDTITIVAVNGSSGGIGSLISTLYGTVTVQSDGTFVYNPNYGFSGMDTFTFTRTDGYVTITGTATIMVM